MNYEQTIVSVSYRLSDGLALVADAFRNQENLAKGKISCPEAIFVYYLRLIKR
jgi:hypothetical protein